MKVLNSDIAIPLYQQLYDLLLDQIRSGIYPPGTKIPSEEELCKTYDLSRVTVRSALGRLVDDNILVKKHGKGTFVATPIFTESAYAKGSFTRSCQQMGATPSTQVVSRKLVKAGKALAKQLQMEEGAKAICIKRLRCINEVAAILEVDYFTEALGFMMEADVETRPVLTVRSALGRLVDDNILVKKHGKGTFVATPIFTESAYAKGSFTRSCQQMGATPSTQVVSRKLVKAGKALAKQLQMEEGAKAICIKRLRCINEVAAILEVDYFTEALGFMMEADVETRPVLDVIRENSGLIGRQYIDTFEVHFANREQAACLKCPVNTPLLKVSQVVLNEMRGVLYYNEQYIRSDIYKYVMGS